MNINMLRVIGLILSIGLLFTSCQKVIDVKLKDASPKYIVEAVITDEAGYNNITISQSKPFDEDNTFPTISGADVIVTDLTDNTTYIFTESSPGTYTHPTLATTLDHEYALEININGEIITGKSKMPAAKVELDSVSIGKSDFSTFIGYDYYVAIPVYTDPIEKGNNYLVKSFLNGVNTIPYEYDNDEFRNGQTNKGAVDVAETDPDEEEAQQFLPGDTITMELYCTDRPVYTFYRTLSQNSSSALGTPTNPVSNIYGDVIGVFNAATVSRKSTIANY